MDTVITIMKKESPIYAEPQFETKAGSNCLACQTLTDEQFTNAFFAINKCEAPMPIISKKAQDELFEKAQDDLSVLREVSLDALRDTQWEELKEQYGKALYAYLPLWEMESYELLELLEDDIEYFKDKIPYSLMDTEDLDDVVETMPEVVPYIALRDLQRVSEDSLLICLCQQPNFAKIICKILDGSDAWVLAMVRLCSTYSKKIAELYDWSSITPAQERFLRLNAPEFAKYLNTK